MTITKNLDGTHLNVLVEGRVDTVTAPEFESQVAGALDTVTALTLDLENLEYISSAGLRVLLSLQKTMQKKGEMVLKNVKPEVMEIFDVTGFSDILSIE